MAIDGSADNRAVSTESDKGSRVEAVQRAIGVWSGQLVDLSARNNLLFFKDLRAGTLDLAAVRPEKLAGLLAGRTFPLSALLPDPEAFAEVRKRGRTIHNRSQELFEERGLQTLYLAFGMATWENQRRSAKPAAPVLLVPARLAARGAAQEDFELSVTGELEVNPTLIQLLATEFDCRCDPDELLDHAGIDGAIDTPEELETTYDWLKHVCGRVPGFDVAPRIVLGTFSYAKLPMVQDLENNIETLASHDLIAAIAGDREARAALRERQADVDPRSPDHTPLADEFLVLDADASQNYAINAVLAGQDVIVKGPPGTGKSQTIANLVSSLVARGKKVLFVAEKRAAIDAVLSRLDDRGLGDLVLDLHGGGSSRRQIAQELAAALDANRKIAKPDTSAQQRDAQTRRDELNAHVRALHEPRNPWGVSVFDANNLLLAIGAANVTPIRLRGGTLDRVDNAVYQTAREALRDFAGRGGLWLERSGKPWARATVVSAEQAQVAFAAADRLRRHTLPRTLERLREAAGGTGVSDPGTVGAWAERLGLWAGVRETQGHFDAELWAEALDEITSTLAPLAEGAMARAGHTLTDGEYRRARKRVKQLIVGERPSPAEVHERLTVAHERLSAWQAAAPTNSSPSVPEQLDELSAAHAQLIAELDELGAHLGRDDLATLDEPTIRALLDGLLGDQATLAKLPQLHALREQLLGLGLVDLLADLQARDLPPEAALQALEHCWLSSILERVSLTDPAVGAFDGAQHTRTVEEYRAADAAHIETSAARVRRLAAERATAAQDEHADEAELVRHQAALKRKHLPIRHLFGAAPSVLTALKPCWAMSPLVVSQILPADKRYFDVVVFDEASQVRPADAIPAIARGEQLVVAGDERQLPPTDFFTGGASRDGGDDVDVDPTTISVGTDFESILEALSAFVPFRMLQWHYRSRDERLIAFSNAYLYDRSLITFPGVTGADCLSHELVDFHEGQIGSEESGGAEVQRVVELILEHAEKRPEQSLGVIAMGSKHADRIDQTLRTALEGRDDLEGFFSEAKPERFFVKNLERVQGDERDAIILAVGYGKTPNGRLLYRFGPLNNEGGERRLNVAVTRAKQRMTLVSSFSHHDMDPKKTTREGVELLRLYLQYAASAGSNLGDAATERPALNAFEIDVRDRLTRAGVPVTAQYGCSGYWIDFAAAHPEQPGRMVLAIECDGASYHSSQTARDRDRLRQDQLERLGWTFHRIWSQDWFADPEREVQRAVDSWRQAVALADAPQPRSPDQSATAPWPTAPPRPAVAPSRGQHPRIRYGAKIDEYTPKELLAIVDWVESDTLLRTEDELLAEVISEMGYARRGSRIVAALTAAIATARSRSGGAAGNGAAQPQTSVTPAGPPAPAAANDTVQVPAHPNGTTPPERPRLRVRIPSPGSSPRRTGAAALELDEMMLCVIDCETTGVGLDDRIIELAALRVAPDGTLLGQLSTLVDPGRPVAATHIHGISDAQVHGAPRFEDVAPELAALADGALLVAHNASFDVRMVCSELERLGARSAPAWACTMRLRALVGLPGPGSHKLTWAAWQEGIFDAGDAHHALDDAAVCGALAHRYFSTARQLGARALGDLRCDGAMRASWSAPVGLGALGQPGRLQPRPRSSKVRAALPVCYSGQDAQQSYRRALADALEDFVLTDSEVARLATSASAAGLSAEAVRQAHRERLHALVETHAADGHIDWVEAQQVRAFARAMGLPDNEVDTLLADQAAAGARVDEAAPADDPTLSALRVVFTGELDGLGRQDAIALARQAGMLVTGSVSAKTDLLVTNAPEVPTGKQRAAREFGTLIVDERLFLGLCGVPPVDARVAETLARLAERDAARAAQKTNGSSPAEGSSALRAVLDDGTQVLWCANGQHEWERPGQRGRTPSSCAEHS